MSVSPVRRRGIVLGVAVGGAVAAAVVGMSTANAQSNDLTSVLVASLGDVSAVADHDLAALTADLPGSAAFSASTLTDAHANLVEGVDVLTQLQADFDVSSIASEINVHNRLAGFVDRLQDAQDNISAHTGALAPTIESLFLDPLNQAWLSSTDSLLTADHAFADALINDLGLSELNSAQASMLSAAVPMLGLELLSMPVLYFSGVVDLFGG